VGESLVPLASSAWLLMLLWRPSSVAMLVSRQLLLRVMMRLLGQTYCSDLYFSFVSLKKMTEIFFQ
jgi:hypothetical protein